MFSGFRSFKMCRNSMLYLVFHFLINQFLKIMKWWDISIKANCLTHKQCTPYLLVNIFLQKTVYNKNETIDSLFLHKGFLFIFGSNYFKFNQKIYKHIRGVWHWNTVGPNLSLPGAWQVWGDSIQFWSSFIKQSTPM